MRRYPRKRKLVYRLPEWELPNTIRWAQPPAGDRAPSIFMPFDPEWLTTPPLAARSYA